MTNFIVIATLIFVCCAMMITFVCCAIMIHIKNIEKEIELQNEINRLTTERLDAISKQIDILSEMVDLESKRLDIYKNDDDENDDWWKKS
jgi:mannitol-specific phosphotransferase system IIBC component